MSKDVTVNNTGGLGFFSVLFLIFLTLKLTNVIAWSWWLVTAPLWAPFAVVLVVLLVIFIGAVISNK